MKKNIKLSTDYKGDLKQNENENQNATEKPNINEEKQIRKSSSKLHAYIYLDNANKSKYESIFKNLNQQFSLGNNQYPKSKSKINNQSKQCTKQS